MKASILFLFLFAFQGLWGQNRVGTPVPGSSPDRNFEDYLVNLAWANTPSNKVYESEMYIKNQRLSVAKRDWYDDASLTINFNGRNICDLFPTLKGCPANTDPNNPIRALSNYPIWNLGTQINLGTLLNSKNKISIAQEEVKISELELAQRKIVVKTEVLKRYQKYLLAINQLKARTEAVEAAQTNYDLYRELFQNNKIEIEQLNKSAESYYNALDGKLRSASEVNISKLEIEELIGIKWEQAEKYKTN